MEIFHSYVSLPEGIPLHFTASLNCESCFGCIGLHTTVPAKPQRPNKMQGALLRLCSQGRPHCTLRRVLGHGSVYRGSQVSLRAVGLSHGRAMLLRRQHENRRGTRGGAAEVRVWSWRYCRQGHLWSNDMHNIVCGNTRLDCDVPKWRMFMMGLKNWSGFTNVDGPCSWPHQLNHWKNHWTFPWSLTG